MRLVSSLIASAAIAASVVPAAAQAPQPLPPSVFAPTPDSVVQGVAQGITIVRATQTQNRTDVVDRIMSFDRNGDNRVDRNELPERMMHLFVQGDADGDGALIAAEAIVLVDRQSGTAPAESFAVGRKATSIADVISDLRLEKPTHDAVMEILKNFSAIRNVNNSRQLGPLDVNTYIRGLLSDEEYENYEAAVARTRGGQSVNSVVVGR